eukprot:m.130806 g.130806  ORF g.130806 m.130806 type:complete len:74 (-) comp13911_c1_seq2:109-330(-)
MTVNMVDKTLFVTEEPTFAAVWIIGAVCAVLVAIFLAFVYYCVPDPDDTPRFPAQSGADGQTSSPAAVTKKDT